MSKETSTKLHIMNVAEELFGERGIDAVSMRTISERSNTKNKSAAQYYFGDKHGLVVATMRHRRHEIDTLRSELAGIAPDQLDELSVGELIRLVMIPITNFRGTDGRRRYAAFLKEVLFYDPFYELWTDQEIVGPFSSSLIDALRGKFKGKSSTLVDFRLKTAFRFMVASIVDFDRGKITPPLDENIFFDELIRIAQAILLD